MILRSLILSTALICAGTFAQAERLVLASASYGKNIVGITDAKGDMVWEYQTKGGKRGHAGHHDIQLLDNGNILFHENWTKVLEITLDKEIVWEYDCAAMNGNKGKRVDVHAFGRLENGNTWIAESGVGRIIEVDKDGKLISEFPLGEGGRRNTRLVRRLENGNFLACAENPGVVTEYSPKGEVVWEYAVKTRVYGATRLKNGNTLIGSGSGNSIIVVNPEGERVWEVSKKVPDTEVTLKWVTMVTELPNGNFIVGNCHAGPNSPQIFEITPEKKVVWEFNEFETFGNGLACSQVLTDKQSALVREKLAASKSK